MATFALVHGAWLGPWCWENLVPELEAQGHRVIVMDLPVDDSAATFDDYADIVCAAIRDVRGDDLVLVGHSMGGQTIPLVAARRPLRCLVYLCGVPPIPGRPFAQQMIDEPEMLNRDYPSGLGVKDAEGRRNWIDQKLAHSHVFGDCDEATASAAFARLRPQSMEPYKVPCSLPAYPAVDTKYIVCEQDRMVNPPWSRRIARDWLKAEIVELPGGHSPFYSRPTDLAAALSGLA
ncbi:alpha/beta hydrolase [Mycobacterium sp. OAE908]|uniref:alpha/beta fold hydrolase n=1 Tax=Mycobacterium sp. OAE908 TaxID=2817899 RepID=UPI001AE3EF8D